MTIERATWLTTDKDRNAARALADLASGRTGMDEPKCETCRYCSNSRDTGVRGNCRRYPPHPHHGFAPTAPERWCGEYKPEPEVGTCKTCRHSANAPQCASGEVICKHNLPGMEMHCAPIPDSGCCDKFEPESPPFSNLGSAVQLVGDTYGIDVRIGNYGDGSLREQHCQELLAEAARLRFGGKRLPGGFHFGGQGEHIEPAPAEIKHPAECCETCRSFNKYPASCLGLGECGFAVAMGHIEHDVRRSDTCRWHKAKPATEFVSSPCRGCERAWARGDSPLPKGLVE